VVNIVNIASACASRFDDELPRERLLPPPAALFPYIEDALIGSSRSPFTDEVQASRTSPGFGL